MTQDVRGGGEREPHHVGLAKRQGRGEDAGGRQGVAAVHEQQAQEYEQGRRHVRVREKVVKVVHREERDDRGFRPCPRVQRRLPSDRLQQGGQHRHGRQTKHGVECAKAGHGAHVWHDPVQGCCQDVSVARAGATAFRARLRVMSS